MKWEWKPNVSVGLFTLGEPVVVSKLPFEARLVDDYGDQCVFELRDEKVRFSVESDVVISVELFGSVYYKEVELIGLEIGGLGNVICMDNCLKKFHDGFGVQVTCDDLGAVFWGESGRVESITVYKRDQKVWGQSEPPPV